MNDTQLRALLGLGAAVGLGMAARQIVRLQGPALGLSPTEAQLVLALSVAVVGRIVAARPR